MCRLIIRRIETKAPGSAIGNFDSHAVWSGNQKFHRSDRLTRKRFVPLLSWSSIRGLDGIFRAAGRELSGSNTIEPKLERSRLIYTDPTGLDLIGTQILNQMSIKSGGRPNSRRRVQRSGRDLSGAASRQDAVLKTVVYGVLALLVSLAAIPISRTIYYSNDSPFSERPAISIAIYTGSASQRDDVRVRFQNAYHQGDVNAAEVLNVAVREPQKLAIVVSGPTIHDCSYNARLLPEAGTYEFRGASKSIDVKHSGGYAILQLQPQSGVGYGHFEDITCALSGTPMVVSDSFDRRWLSFFYMIPSKNLMHLLDSQTLREPASIVVDAANLNDVDDLTVSGSSLEPTPPGLAPDTAKLMYLATSSTLRWTVPGLAQQRDTLQILLGTVLALVATIAFEASRPWLEIFINRFRSDD